MKAIFCIFSIISAVLILGINQTVQAQTAVNFTKLFQDKFRRAQNSDPRLPPEPPHQEVIVRYESPTTVLINGDLILEDLGAFNSFLWQAMDMLKNQYGFKVQSVMTNGVGSEGNPTDVYILMTK